MILLEGHSLTPKARFAPESMPMTLVDSGVSTATITVGPDAPEIRIDDWLKDDAAPGKGVVWRVKGVDTAYETRTRTVQLEHVIATLKDALLFGEITTKALGGGSSVEAEKAARYVLGRQSIWALGDFEFSRALPYSFNNATVFQALETICSTLPDWRWEYDLSALPFRLHVRKKSGAVGCELRSDRNLITLKRTVDRTGMYTRFYPVGARNMHIDGDYVSKNETLYGVVSKTETDQSISKKPLLKAWAEDRLAAHAEPLVTVSISGLELSAATGEPLDNIRLGLNCRVPLPEYGTTILERVTKLSWSDKIREPERVSVTLANQPNDVANILRQLSSSGSRNSGGGAKAQEEDHAWIVDTADHVALVAEAIVGRDGETVDWSRVSEIIVDGEGIHQRVTKTEGALVVAQTRIEMNEKSITLEATRAKNAENGLSGRITVEANRITAEVTERRNGDNALSSRITVEANRITSEVTDRTNADATLSSRITQTADAITSEVTRATAAEGTLSSRITQTADAITSEVTRATTAEGTLSSRITQTADSITSEVTRATTAEGTLSSRITQTDALISAEVTRAQAAESSLSGRITVASDKVALVVSEVSGGYVVNSAEIVAGINGQTGSYVKIRADTINLSGYVTASELQATNASIDNLKSGSTTASFLKANSMATESFSVNSGGSFRFRGYTAAWKLASFKNGDGGTTEFYYIGRN